MPRSLSLGAPAGVLVVSFVGACTGPAPASPPSSGPGSALVAQRADDSTRAQGLIEQGEYETAREVLDDIVFTDSMAKARAALAAGAPEDALLAVDRALKILPGDSGARLLKADASLQLAESKLRTGGGSAGLIQGTLMDALEYYQGGPESAHALFGASRAAWLLGRNEEALDLARRAQPLRGPSGEEIEGLGFPPERIYAEELLAAYSAARSAEDETASAALFSEGEEAFARLIGRACDDPWAWSRYADLYEWAGRAPEALGILERGLARAPEDGELLVRLARVAREAEGGAAAVRRLEVYVAAHPELVAGRWQLARARFDAALDGYQATPRVLDGAPFARAELDFVALRAAAPELASEALKYEVVCRLARGWCRYHADDLPGAVREFLAMNALFERGIEWSLPGALESGIQGLFYVADTYNQRGEMLPAGEAYDTLRHLQPDEIPWANNAGFCLREGADDLENQGVLLCLAARGELTDPEGLAKLRALEGVERAQPGSEAERAAFARAADRHAARAREVMERSLEAYERAHELAPDDVRIENDTALIQVYYLHRDLERAQRMLEHAVARGAEQVPALEAEIAEAPPEARADLESSLEQLRSAWGDAHENLGVLAWVHRRDAAAAEPMLEKAVAIGPDRPPVQNVFLPQVRGELARDENSSEDLLNWARPCSTR